MRLLSLKLMKTTYPKKRSKFRQCVRKKFFFVCGLCKFKTNCLQNWFKIKSIRESKIWGGGCTEYYFQPYSINVFFFFLKNNQIICYINFAKFFSPKCFSFNSHALFNNQFTVHSTKLILLPEYYINKV